MLVNDIVFLRPLEIEDSDLIREWRFSPDNYDFFYEFTPSSRGVNLDWTRKAVFRKDEVNFIICKTETAEALGMISVLNIDFRNQTCEMGRVLIGENKFRGQSCGKNAVSLLLEYCFKHLNMRKIYCEVFEDNKRAAALYEKFGFKIEGTLNQHIYKNGDFKNVLILALYRGN